MATGRYKYAAENAVKTGKTISNAFKAANEAVGTIMVATSLTCNPSSTPYSDFVNEAATSHVEVKENILKGDRDRAFEIDRSSYPNTNDKNNK